MVYRTEQVRMGLTINISTHRKNGNGAVGGGRTNETGKKATVSKEGCADVIVTGNTTRDLLSKLRVQFKIPTNITVNGKGQTCI